MGCICKASELVWLVAGLGGGRGGGKRGAERQRAGGRKGPIWGGFINLGRNWEFVWLCRGRRGHILQGRNQGRISPGRHTCWRRRGRDKVSLRKSEGVRESTSEQG